MIEKTPTSRELKKKQFRLSVFPKKEAVSRTEISERTGLNLRTIAAYAEEYKKLGFVIEKSIADGKGRPSVYYESNVNNLLFGGITITFNKLYLVLLDVNRYILGAKSIEIKDSDASSSTIITETIKTFDSLLAENPDKKLAGLGLCVNEYRLEAKYLKVFNELESVLAGKYAVNTIKENANTVALDRLRYLLNQNGNLALLHMADEIRIGLILNNKMVPNTDHWRKKFAHFPVEPAGPTCYCGRYGCLTSYLTHSATIMRYCQKAGLSNVKDFNIYKFRLLVEEKDSLALSIANENGRYLGKAILHFVSELNLSRVYLYAIDPATAAGATSFFRKSGGADNCAVEFCNYPISDVCIGAAEMLINYYFT